MVDEMNEGFEDLEVWQKSRVLAKRVYIATQKFPLHEQYGLTSQIRRSAISIISNIAEGSARATDNDFLRFVSIALGSASELKAQLIIASDLSYLSEDEFLITKEEINRIGRMLKGLQKSIRQKNNIIETVS